MSDTISRQAVLTKFQKICNSCGEYEKHNGVMCGSCYFETAIDIVEEEPSAQPEIIRCKGCKHKHLENAVWTCPFGLPGGPDFYCGYGAERRSDGN